MKIQLLPACPVKIGTTSKRTLQQGIAIIKNEINQTSTVPQIPVTSWYSLVPLVSFYTHLLACLRFPIWKGSSYSSRVCTLLMAAASMSTNCPSYLVSQLFLHAKEFTWHLTHAICFSRATCVHVFYRAGITISWSAWRCSVRADPFHSSSQPSTYQVISELFGDGKDLRSAKLFMSASNLWIPLVLGLPFFGSPNCGNWWGNWWALIFPDWGRCLEVGGGNDFFPAAWR